MDILELNLRKWSIVNLPSGQENPPNFILEHYLEIANFFLLLPAHPPCCVNKSVGPSHDASLPCALIVHYSVWNQNSRFKFELVGNNSTWNKHVFTCRTLDQSADVCGHRWKHLVDSDGSAWSGAWAWVEKHSHSAPHLSHSQASMSWGEILSRRWQWHGKKDLICTILIMAFTFCSHFISKWGFFVKQQLCKAELISVLTTQSMVQYYIYNIYHN